MKRSCLPRLLIIGQSFTTTSGGGITLINLFRGWDPDKLAVLTTDIDYTQELIAKHYYQIGVKEERWIFPLNLFQRKLASGPVLISDKRPNESAARTTRSHARGLRFILKEFTYATLRFLGLYHAVYRYQLSEELWQWIKEFNPEVVYSQATSLQSINLTHEILDNHTAKSAIHIMDDYLTTMIRPGIRSKHWKKILDRQFRRLVKRSSLLLSICQGMSDEYEKRYHRTFLPFHNPIDTQKWIDESRLQWLSGVDFRIMYGGRIGPGTSHSVVDIAAAIDELAERNLNIHFEVFTFSHNEQILKEIRALKNCSTPEPLPHHKMPAKLAAMDLLVLPIDFDPEGLRYIRLSMPTKVSEYMASGTPILVYAPQETALAQYARTGGWAYTVMEQRRERLVEAFLELWQNPKLRQSLGEKAKRVALENHDAKVVRSQFQEALGSLVNPTQGNHG